MSPFEYYFSIINIILLSIIFIWSYIINFNYNKNINEIKKIKEEVEKIKEEIRSEEQFYKSIVTNLSDYLSLINKNKKQVIKNPTPPQIIKKEEKKEILDNSKIQTFFQKIKNFFNKNVKDVFSKKNEELKEIKKNIHIPTPIPVIPPIQTPVKNHNINKGEGKKQEQKDKENENWKKK